MTLEKCLLNVLSTSPLQLGHKSPTLHFLDNVLFIGYLFWLNKVLPQVSLLLKSITKKVILNHFYTFDSTYIYLF